MPRHINQHYESACARLVAHFNNLNGMSLFQTISNEAPGLRFRESHAGNSAADRPRLPLVRKSQTARARPSRQRGKLSSMRFGINIEHFDSAT